MNLLTSESLPYVLAQALWKEAKRGHLWVPEDVSEERADALAAVVRAGSAAKELTVHIDTHNGTHSVWGLADALLGYKHTTAEIGWRCKSAGLIIACACERRVCKPHTEFLFHGSPYKNGLPDDRRKAQWFAKRTGTSEEFWWDLAAGGQDFCFDAERALSLGVVHEVAG